jgi:hypothetical protein
MMILTVPKDAIQVLQKDFGDKCLCGQSTGLYSIGV